jgi:molybdenum cofactor cytidylyltransferase
MGAAKPALRHGDLPLLRHVLDGLGGGWFGTFVVVGGVHEATVRATVPHGAARVLRNDTPERGQLSSLKVAVRHLRDAGPMAMGVVVALADHPSVSPATVDRLVEATGDGRRPIIVPVHHGRRGHPVVLLRAVWDELLATPDEESARVVVRRDATRVREVAVDDPGVLVDIDTPADLAGLRAVLRPSDEP